MGADLVAIVTKLSIKKLQIDGCKITEYELGRFFNKLNVIEKVTKRYFSCIYYIYI